MFGRTTRVLLNSFQKLAPMLQIRTHLKNLRFLPLSCDPVYIMNSGEEQHTASLLVPEFQTVFSGSPISSTPSLNGVPAYIPSKYHENGKVPKLMREFFDEIPGYKKIFKGAKPEISVLDTIVTGVGVISEEDASGSQMTGAFLRERLALEPELDWRQLSTLVYGDIGGVLVPRHGKEEHEWVTRLNAGWTGLQVKHLDAFRQSSKKRLILIAYNSSKAEVIREVLRCGWVQHLIISATVSTALVSLEKQRTKKKGKSNRKM